MGYLPTACYGSPTNRGSWAALRSSGRCCLWPTRRLCEAAATNCLRQWADHGTRELRVRLSGPACRARRGGGGRPGHGRFRDRCPHPWAAPGNARPARRADARTDRPRRGRGRSRAVEGGLRAVEGGRGRPAWWHRSGTKDADRGIDLRVDVLAHRPRDAGRAAERAGGRRAPTAVADRSWSSLPRCGASGTPHRARVRRPYSGAAAEPRFESGVLPLNPGILVTMTLTAQTWSAAPPSRRVRLSSGTTRARCGPGGGQPHHGRCPRPHVGHHATRRCAGSVASRSRDRSSVVESRVARRTAAEARRAAARVGSAATASWPGLAR